MVRDEPDLREDVLPGIILFHLGVGARALRQHDDPLLLIVLQETSQKTDRRMVALSTDSSTPAQIVQLDTDSIKAVDFPCKMNDLKEVRPKLVKGIGLCPDSTPTVHTLPTATTNEPDLAHLVAAWDRLPDEIKARLMAIVQENLTPED
jgi:hypothetical protein